MLEIRSQKRDHNKATRTGALAAVFRREPTNLKFSLQYFAVYCIIKADDARENDNVKKFIKFALLICLLVLGAAAVYSVRFPEVQPALFAWGSIALAKTGDFLKRIGEAFLAVFIESR